MGINIQTDLTGIDNSKESQNAFTTAFNNGTKIFDDIQQGREKATVNKLYGESLKQDGTLDTNKLTQGLASTGLGAKIPELLKQAQANEIQQLNIAKGKVEKSQSQLALIGQVMGDITTVDDYKKGIETLKSQGIDTSNYPDALDDNDATKKSQFAAKNAMSYQEKLDLAYKNSEIAARREKYQLDREEAKAEAESKASREQADNDFRNRQQTETERHNTVSEQNAANKANEMTPYQQDQIAMKRDKAEQDNATKISDTELAYGNANAKLQRTQSLLNNPALKKINIFSNAVGALGNSTGLYNTEVGTLQAEIESKVNDAVGLLKENAKGVQTDKDELTMAKSLVEAHANKDPVAMEKALTRMAENEQRIVNKHKADLDTFKKWKPNDSGITRSQPSTKPSLKEMQAKYPANLSEGQKAHLDAKFKAQGYE
jgi:hypothetical protein